MGKVLCVCGEIISDVCGADGFVASFVGKEEDERDVLECKKCGCLIIDDPLNFSKCLFYIPSNDKCNFIF